MQTWFGFYTVTAGAAAALAGLLFVAVSVNVAAILGDAQGNSRRLAEQAFQNYLAVLLVSLLAMFPSMSLAELGFVTLCVTAAWAIWVLARAYLALARPYPSGSRLHSLRRQTSIPDRVWHADIRRPAHGLEYRRQPHLFAVATIILLFWPPLCRGGC